MRGSMLVMLSLLVAGPSLAAESLCGVGETTVFACRMGAKPGARIASLCADEHAKPWRLAYRFGTPSHIELAYPGAGETGAFRHAIISYSAIGGDAVTFTHGDATYALFYVLGHDTDFKGVSVRHGDKELANLSCAENSIDAMTTEFFAGAGLLQEDGQFDVPEVFFDRAARTRR